MKFLAILGFVVMAFVILAVLVMFVGFSAIPHRSGMPPVFGPIIGVLYLVMDVFFYLIPCIYLLRYGSAIASISASGQDAIESALKYQKSFCKYLGIFAIVVIAFYVLCTVGGIAFAIIYGSMHHP